MRQRGCRLPGKPNQHVQYPTQHNSESNSVFVKSMQYGSLALLANRVQSAETVTPFTLTRQAYAHGLPNRVTFLTFERLVYKMYSRNTYPLPC